MNRGTTYQESSFKEKCFLVRSLDPICSPDYRLHAFFLLLWATEDARFWISCLFDVCWICCFFACLGGFSEESWLDHVFTIHLYLCTIYDNIYIYIYKLFSVLLIIRVKYAEYVTFQIQKSIRHYRPRVNLVIRHQTNWSLYINIQINPNFKEHYKNTK